MLPTRGHVSGGLVEPVPGAVKLEPTLVNRAILVVVALCPVLVLPTLLGLFYGLFGDVGSGGLGLLIACGVRLVGRGS